MSIKISALLSLLLLCACADNSPTVRSAEVFGTQITIIINDLPQAEAAAAVAEVLLHWQDMHGRFHAWRAGETTEINRAIAAQQFPISLSAPMAKMLSLSIDYSRCSNGLFNPAAGQLVSLWGFHADVPPTRPPVAVADYLPPPMTEVKLRGRFLDSAPMIVRFDFGAIAKGAALDDARDILRRRGVKNALINAGGNILAMGKNNERPWRILLFPANMTLSLADGEAVATSGGGARYFIYEGRRYHHIINPRSGTSAAEIVAATALSDDLQHAGALSDAAATALAIADSEEAGVIVENFGLAAALQISTAGSWHLFADMARRL